VFVARYILENPIRTNGIFSFFSATDPLKTFFNNENYRAKEGWAVQSILGELPSISAITDPIYYASIHKIFETAFRLKAFEVKAVDENNESSEKHALLVDTHHRDDWSNKISEWQEKIKNKSTFDNKKFIGMSIGTPPVSLNKKNA
jgi:hypothetical protein